MPVYFVKNLKKENNINEYRKLNILDGIEMLNAKNSTESFPFHKHETYNVSLILQNVFQTDIADQSFLAPSASIAITNPNEFHATPCNSVVGNSFFTFYIPQSIISYITGNKNTFIIDKVVDNPIIFNNLLQLASISKTSNSSFEGQFLHTLSLLINNCRTDTPTKCDNNSIRQFIKEIITETDHFSLDSIQKKYGINVYKFIRLFKEEIGISPKKFFLYKRIEKSKLMLQEGYPIPDVALACGFYDSPHFYKYFKRYIGVSPLEFQSAFTA